MRNREEKDKKIKYLLLRMQKEPMSVHKMADAVNMPPKSVSKYITELRFKKMIHIARYGQNNIGAYTVHYMTGNFPDVIKPSRLDKPKARKPLKRVPNKFSPRPDVAAAWLFNPINEKYDY